MSPAATRIGSVEELEALVGSELGPSSWLEVDQARIDAFAAATDDRQWIHVDRDRAAAGPFGTTIAHGFLTLALVVPAWYELTDTSAFLASVNYGVDRVRFPAPVPAGSRIRVRFTIEEATRVEGGAQARASAVVERDGSEKPVCVAQLVFRFVGS